MVRSEQAVTIDIRVDPSSALDEGTRGNLARALGRHLAGLPDTTIGPVASGPAPTGAKSASETFALGALALTVAPIVVQQALQWIGDWVKRPGAAHVKLALQVGENRIEAEFDPKATSVEDLRAVADALARVQAQVAAAQRPA
jgi:hypothetical protein